MSAARNAPGVGDGPGWYLYGVVAAEDAPAQLNAAPAVDPRHEVVVVAEGPLAGVTSRVSLIPERLGARSPGCR